jgi:multidrug efflux pump subunit AcrA (membrane-fusion protein)
MKIITWKRITFLIAVLASAAAFIFYRSAAGTASEYMPKQTAPIAVRTVRPVTRNMEISVSYLGTAAARKEVKVIARVPGRVTEIPFREGDRAA